MSSKARVVLVTGASTGFGRAIAEHLVEQGYKVYGTSRRPQKAGGRFPFIAMDVDNDASVAAGVAEVISREGRLDAVVGNAGMGFAGAIEDTTCEEGLAQFQTNFFGNHRLVRAALSARRNPAPDVDDRERRTECQRQRRRRRRPARRNRPSRPPPPWR